MSSIEIKLLEKQRKALPFILAVLFCFVGEVQAQEAEHYTICKIGKTVRSIRVEKAPGGYSTIYTKEGVDSVVGGGQWAESCVKIASNIQANLEKAGWKCKTVEQANVSELQNSAGEQKTEQP